MILNTLIPSVVSTSVFPASLLSKPFAPTIKFPPSPSLPTFVSSILTDNGVSTVTGAVVINELFKSVS